MKAMEKEIFSYIEPLCINSGTYLQGVSIHGAGKDRIIRVTADTDKGITLDECQMLSSKISDYFYRKNIFEGNYRLEVTSPGAEKPLEYDYEFKRNIGRRVEIEYQDTDKIESVDGILAEYTGDIILIRNKIGDIQIPVEHLKRVRVKLQW
jgi:ribosome maturation factor RimP